MVNPIPEKWCIKATNDEEAKVIAKYASNLCEKIGNDLWSFQDAYDYYLIFENGEYKDGFKTIPPGTEDITYKDFKTYVLNEPEIVEIDTTPVDYSYLIPLLKELER